MKKIFLAVVLLCLASASFAHGSSHAKSRQRAEAEQAKVAASARPANYICIIPIRGTNGEVAFNANSLTTVYVFSTKVTLHVGRDTIYINAPVPTDEANRILTTIEEKCKK